MQLGERKRVPNTRNLLVRTDEARFGREIACNLIAAPESNYQSPEGSEVR